MVRQVIVSIAFVAACGHLPFVSLLALPAQRASESDIQAAISAGQNKKTKDLFFDCTAGAGFGQNFAAGMAGGIQYTGSFTVYTANNLGRVAFIAFDAKRLYKPFSIDMISDDLKQPGIYVWIEPDKPTASGNTYSVPAMIETVVLRSKQTPARFIRTASLETETVEWSNLLGGKVSSNRASARFDYGEFRELPMGDIDVVVVTPAGERKCGLSVNERVKLTQSSAR